MPVIGTYNMSFASDKGLTIGSEKKFLEDNCTDRSCWKNALIHLKDFIKEKKPLAVGLQEMNLIKPDDEKVLKHEDGFWKNQDTGVSGGGGMYDRLLTGIGWKKKESGPVSKYTIYKYTVRDKVQKGKHTGTAAIDNILRGLQMENENNSNDLDYNAIHGEVAVDNNVKPAVTIIYKDELGELVACKIIDNVVIHGSGDDEKPAKGRPILFALIHNKEKNESTLLISMHGAQDPSIIPDGGFTDQTKTEFDTYMTKNNKEFLQGEVERFLTDAEKGEMKLNNVYIMGDFNDRFGAIKEIEIDGKKATYQGTAPKSCCYNYDSMGNKTDEEKNTPTEKKDFYQGIKSKKALDQGKIQKNDQGEEVATIQGSIGFEELKNTGKVENYFNEGDKIFAFPKAGKLEIYKYNEIKDKPSDRSDHELVFMDTGGGGGFLSFLGIGGAKKKTKKKRRKGGMSCGTKHKKKSKKTKRKGGSNCSKKNN